MARLEIEPVELHWLNTENPGQDLCAHGGVKVRFEGNEVFRTKESGLSVSTGAVYLLRCLCADHLNTDEEHLFPCCAFEMRVDAGRVVNVTGCGHGEDWRIAHDGNQVRLHFYGGLCVEVSAQEWRDAVLEFSSDVRAFYFREMKRPGHGDSEWFDAFVTEWSERHASASRL